MKLHVVKELCQALTPNNTCTHRVVIQKGIIHDILLVNTTDKNIEFRYRLNGIQIIHPITGEELFAVPADTALQLPKEFYIQTSRNPIIFEFETGGPGVEICVIYLESTKT